MPLRQGGSQSFPGEARPNHAVPKWQYTQTFRREHEPGFLRQTARCAEESESSRSVCGGIIGFIGHIRHQLIRGLQVDHREGRLHGDTKHSPRKEFIWLSLVVRDIYTVSHPSDDIQSNRSANISNILVRLTSSRSSIHPTTAHADHSSLKNTPSTTSGSRTDSNEPDRPLVPQQHSLYGSKQVLQTWLDKSVLPAGRPLVPQQHSL
jgi:hypothetical protein